MKPRDTIKKSRPICNLCGEILINRLPQTKFCKECGRTMKSMERNKKKFIKRNKEIIEDKDYAINSLKDDLESQNNVISALKSNLKSREELVDGLNKRIKYHEKKEKNKSPVKECRNILLCPSCKYRTDVIDGRVSKYGFRRRRVCSKCKHRFTTYEVLL